MCCFIKKIVHVELVKTIVGHSLSITPKASTLAVSCFGPEEEEGKTAASKEEENKTKDASSWGIPVLKELILLCAEQ